MKKLLNFLLFAILLSGCTGNQKPLQVPETEIIFELQDKEILDQIVKLFSGEKNTPIGVLMVRVGVYFLNTPYVAHTLETGDEEKLVINLRGLDCTTFAENCLGISRMLRSKNPGFESFVKELQFLRYRNGIRDGYPSRLHYFSDWIFDNQEKKLVKDVSQEIAHTILPNRVNFMSSHTESYIQLKNDPSLVPAIIHQENEITSRLTHYIPKSRIAEIEGALQDGDIIGITTNIKGMDISHVGILIRREGRIHLMHASSLLEKVVISNETLDEYLQGSKSATGIMVARPL